MTWVNKEVTFDCAHMLDDYDGDCSNLHGHTYKLIVGVTRKDFITGMLIDFNELKAAIDAVTCKFDHATFINMNSKDKFEQALRRLLEEHNKKYVLVNGLPTAENMGRWIRSEIMGILPDEYQVAVTLYETPTSYAEVL